MWNYRLVETTATGGTEGDNYTVKEIGIYEIYYTDGVPHSRTEHPVSMLGECSEDIADDIKKINLAFEKPILSDDLFMDKV